MEQCLDSPFACCDIHCLNKILHCVEEHSEKIMLIYCHHRKYKDGHFMKELFDEIGQEYNITTYLTLDNSSSRFNNADIKADGFSDNFIVQNEEKYEVVYLPDCGGKWWEYQEKKRYKDLLELIQKVKKLVRPGGALFLGKFPYRECFEHIKKEDTSLKDYTEEASKFIKGLGPTLKYIKPNK
jgi:hypothetical protein